MPEALLEVTGLNTRFGAIAASQDLSLSVRPGELHALIGPNGAGKTTAIDQLSGELTPDSGRILFAGRDITRLPIHQRVRRGLVRSFQITSVFEHLSVYRNMALAVQARQGHSFRFWRSARHDPALRRPTEQALREFGLEQRAEWPARSLSHGEKRQLEVGMAVIMRPRMLLLDEPMAGMGPGGTRELTRLIQGLKGEVTILLVEHDMDVVFALADRITVLVYGRAIACGTPAQIRADPAVQQAYLGNVDPC